ncbi:hypothetical protein [Microbulbifer elongatus]|uniref:hypothetical protein n=1 Tax=Microbulbifer elongatus TaxID=86173 RepID=UPI001CFF195C|nr:hypothetical protein [Microbulbifer elongatus]
MRLILSIVMTFTLSGCVLKDDYPSSWGALPNHVDSRCRDISGLYDNVGENTLENGEYHLAQILLPLYSSKYKVEWVRIDVQANKFKVTIYDTSGDSYESEIGHSEGLKCDGGTYQIARNTVANSGGAIGKQWLSYRIQSNEESLIIEKTQATLGALFFIPIAGQESHWLRFRKP